MTLAVTRSMSLPDGDKLKTVLEAGEARHGGATGFWRHLLDLYARALVAHGSEPPQEAFTAAYLEAERDQLRLDSITKGMRAQAVERELAVVKQEETMRAASPVKFESPAELVRALNARAPIAGEERRAFWEAAAKEHGFVAKDVKVEAGKLYQEALRARPPAPDVWPPRPINGEKPRFGAGVDDAPKPKPRKASTDPFAVLDAEAVQ